MRFLTSDQDRRGDVGWMVSMTDSFPDNPGEKLGSFVEGKVGKGRRIYPGSDCNCRLERTARINCLRI